MNSKYILIILLFQISTFGYSQKLSTTIRQDFCKNAKINYYYGTDSFRSWIVISANRIGLKTPIEIEEALQNICDNIELQDEFFKNVDRLGGSRQFKEQQYIEIGMKPQNAKFLNDYMILKYHSNNNENQVFQPVLVDDFVKDTIIIDKTKLLKSIYPKSNFLNDSLILRKEIVLKIEGGNEEMEFKTTILKEYSFINETKDEERINIIIFSKNEKGFGYFNLLTMKQLKDKSYYSVGRSKRINIEGKKLKDIAFKTIKENRKTYFTMCYTNENDKKTIDYYDINLNFIKTAFLSKNTSQEIQVNNDESKQNEPALIKDIFQKNGKTYVSLDIVQIKYTNENDYNIINQNSKIRTFEFSNNLKIIDKNCINIIDENDYLIKNKDKYISKKNDEICMFSSVDGIITEINLGCWN